MKHPASHAFPIAQDLVKLLEPTCVRIEIAGSLRRRKDEVHDIDLVVIPKTCAFLQQIRDLYGRRPDKQGEHYVCLKSYQGIQVDIYLATERTWPMLLLVKTGSKEHNIALCRRAHDQGFKLHADGQGLEVLSSGVWPTITSEEDIFELLCLPFVPPEQRG